MNVIIPEDMTFVFDFMSKMLEDFKNEWLYNERIEIEFSAEATYTSQAKHARFSKPTIVYFDKLMLSESGTLMLSFASEDDYENKVEFSIVELKNAKLKLKPFEQGDLIQCIEKIGCFSKGTIYPVMQNGIIGHYQNMMCTVHGDYRTKFIKIRK